MCTLSDLSSKPVTVLVVFHFLVLFPKNDAFDFLYNACHSISKVDTKMLVYLSIWTKTDRFFNLHQRDCSAHMTYTGLIFSNISIMFK